jgi:spectrin beta
MNACSSLLQNTLEVAENLIKQHEAFITTTDANDEKINAVLQFANRFLIGGS